MLHIRDDASTIKMRSGFLYQMVTTSFFLLQKKTHTLGHLNVVQFYALNNNIVDLGVNPNGVMWDQVM